MQYMKFTSVTASTLQRGLNASVRQRSRHGRQQFRVMNLFNWLGGSKPKKTGENAEILEWARQAKSGTQAAPATAPDGQEVATFALGT